MAAALEEVLRHEESCHRFNDDHHNSYMLKRICQMRYRSVLTDIVLIVEGKEFPAHKNVLAASSDYFMAMFSGHMATVSDKVHVYAITASAMNLLLDFIYKGDILITEENVEELFCGSCLLLLDSVTQVCCKFIQERLNLTTCWGIRALADKFNSNDLLHRVNAFLVENFKEAVQLDEFLLLRAVDLDEFLQDDDIVIDREEDLFDLLVKWLNHDPENRRGFFPPLLRKIRLPQISKRHLEEVISVHEAVVGDPEACKVIADARRHQHYALESSEENTYDSAWMEPRRCLSGIIGLLTVAGYECVFYGINANTWTQVAGLSTRHCPGIEAMGKYVYVVGGSKEWRRMNNCERYDPGTNRWQSMKPMNVSCSNVGLVSLDGLLYAVGGYDGRSPQRWEQPTSHSIRILHLVPSLHKWGLVIVHTTWTILCNSSSLSKARW